MVWYRVTPFFHSPKTINSFNVSKMQAGGQTVGPGDYSYMCVASLIKCGKSLTLFFLMPSRKGREIKICVFFRAITLFLMNLIDTRNDQIANDVVKKEKKMIK